MCVRLGSVRCLLIVVVAVAVVVTAAIIVVIWTDTKLNDILYKHTSQVCLSFHLILVQLFSHSVSQSANQLRMQSTIVCVRVWVCL